ILKDTNLIIFLYSYFFFFVVFFFSCKKKTQIKNMSSGFTHHLGFSNLSGAFFFVPFFFFGLSNNYDLEKKNNQENSSSEKLMKEPNNCTFDFGSNIEFPARCNRNNRAEKTGQALNMDRRLVLPMFDEEAKHNNKEREEEEEKMKIKVEISKIVDISSVCCKMEKQGNDEIWNNPSAESDSSKKMSTCQRYRQNPKKYILYCVVAFILILFLFHLTP
ncbi:hypothetical protein RFI_28075, partial [Reticulomyxa filosa]